MNFFDLHCDTAYKMFHLNYPLGENPLAVSLEGYSHFEKKAAVFAVWTDSKIAPSKAFEDFSEIIGNLKNHAERNEELAVFCTESDVLCSDDGRLKIIPAVEGADLLENDISRLEYLREKGVRVLAPMWGGENICGGAHDSASGLSDFGYRVIEECEKIGIIIDVSHMSEKSFWDTVNFAKFPIFASHSNSAALCAHSRNLSDTQARTIASGNGAVGVSFVGKHLSKSLAVPSGESSESAMDAAAEHILHFLEKCGAENVCIGSDFDGTEPLPGLERVENVEGFAEYIKNKGIPQDIVDGVFYENAFEFFKNNF